MAQNVQLVALFHSFRVFFSQERKGHEMFALIDFFCNSIDLKINGLKGDRYTMVYILPNKGLGIFLYF